MTDGRDSPPGAARGPARAAPRPPCGRVLLAAALALPGVGAAEPPQAGEGQVSFRWLSYRDRQPGWDRIRVDSPSLAVDYGVDDRWSLAASATADAVSGASPRWHSAVSGASRVSERRHFLDLRVSHEDSRSGFTLSAASSVERDYHSRALGAEARWRSDDGNRTLALAAGLSRDRIGSTDDRDLSGRRRRHELALTLTQVLTPVDVVQAGLTLIDSRGFHDDPYKRVDQRPAGRSARLATLRWNHHVDSLDATLRLHWRGWSDNWAVRAHTLGIEWVKPLPHGWTLAPQLRLHTQSAARFYYDPVYGIAGEPFPPGWLDDPSRPASADARLSAFGALTLGARLSWSLSARWTADLKLEHYAQRSGWRLGGSGSPGLQPLQARFIQIGLTRTF
jgi:hypothetical protein